MRDKLNSLLIFDGKDHVVVSCEVFKQVLSVAGLNWYGIENWSRMDLDLFETKFDGLTCEPFENSMKIWNRYFDYSNLYKLQEIIL